MKGSGYKVGINTIAGRKNTAVKMKLKEGNFNLR